MGQITETLTLTDQFSAPWRDFIDLGNRAVQSISVLDQNLTSALNQTGGETIGALHNVEEAAWATNRLLERIIQNQNDHTAAVGETNQSAGNLLSTFKKIAAVVGSSLFVKAFVGMSDTQTMLSSRLNLMMNQMNDGLRTTKELQEEIFQSAERARGDYLATADAVSKLGLMAGNAFSGTDEIVDFMEQINKQFTIAGTEASGIQAAMLQLTQAMGSGVLRGEEYNSILEQAPNIIQNIGKYIESNEDVMAAAADAMDMKAEDLTGNVQKYLKDLAGEGFLSAELVKAAMFSAADETNEKFESMPKTFQQIGASFRNHVFQAFEPVFERMREIGNSDSFEELVNGAVNGMSVLAGAAADAFDVMITGASWVGDHLDMILPVLGAIGVAYGLLHIKALLTAGANVAAALASAAAWTIAHLPVILLAAMLVGALLSARQFQFGMEDVGAAVGGVLGTLYAIGYDTFANLWNLIASFAEFFANVWNDPLAATARLFFDVFDTILGIVETVAGAIDSLLGSNLQSAVSGFRDKMSDWVDSTFEENAVQIKRMSMLNVKDKADQWSQYGGNLGSKLDNVNFHLEDIAESFSGFNMNDLPLGEQTDIEKVGSVGNVKNVEGDVRLADEDLKLYRDLAERRYMNQIELKTLAPNINVTLPAGAAGNLNASDVADHIKRILIEQMNSHTDMSH